MKRDVVVDMTKGKIAPQILKFAMPVLLGLIFQRIYNFADSWIVGHFLGDNALAAVSVAGVGMYLVFFPDHRTDHRCDGGDVPVLWGKTGRKSG